MTVDHEASGVLQEWVDDAIGDFFLLNPKELSSIAKFLRRLEGKAEELSALQDPTEQLTESASLLHRAAERLKEVIFDQSGDSTTAMKEVSNTLEQIQRSVAGPHQDATVSPAGSLDSDPHHETSGRLDKSETAPWVDETIVAAYIEQQLSVLPEMEQKVLEFEKKADAECMQDLRRMIHTLKGESGMVGAMHIEKVCHQMEDYLENTQDRLESERLLSALDWIERTVRSLEDHNSGESNQEILALLSMDAEGPQAASGPDTAAIRMDGLEAGGQKAVPIADVELAQDFVAESQEHFDSADENLLILEKSRGDADAIGAVFRAFHTIKGVAGFLGLPAIGDLAHVAETLLDEVRKGSRVFEGAVVDVVFNALDTLKDMVVDLGVAASSGGGFRTRPNYPVVLAALQAVQANEPPLRKEEPSAPACPDLDPAQSMDGISESEADVPRAERSPVAQAASAGGVQTMKVDAARIDLLLDTIGELVIAESIVSGEPEIRALKSLRIEKSLSLLGKITRSLQDMGMSMRLVPLDPVFRKMGRLVRDLSKKSGKQVDLVIEGGDTEMDKSMVEKLGDPLVHMIRNSMDHGIEPVAEREAQGKPPVAQIVLRAHHQGGNIHIDIEDDGRGLNRGAIVKKALERGLIHTADGLSDQAIFSLIFEPGFSTAEKVTEISGRGVGMDVVRRNIASLRGNVLIRSTPGKGSVFTLALPLTTAIIDGMLAKVGREVYIIPTLSILESFRPLSGQIHSVAGKGEMVSFRGNLLPLFRLSAVLGATDAATDPKQAIVMVVEEFGKHWGFMVDELLGQQQVVIKSLGDGLGHVPGLAGASILTDGRPGLILDVGGVIRLYSNGQGVTGRSLV